MTIDVELTVKGDIQKLHLEPGDVVAVTLRGVHTQTHFDAVTEIISRAMERVGLKDRYIIMAGENVELSVVGAS